MNNRTLHLKDLYVQVADHVASKPDALLAKSGPLVSVVMTTHNVQAYVEHAITSLLRQTWRPLELVVVDDCSTDETWLIVQRLAREAQFVARRLNANLGTYFAKNMGVQLARGEYVFFQDGDDLCHPERIRLGMHELLKPGALCVQGSYSRVQYPQGLVLPVNGMVFKRGLITLGVQRRVFDEIGYFNCTTKASDDEFFQRLQAFYAERPGAILVQDLPLYYNTWREGSLFADMIANDPAQDGHIEQRPSAVRQAYVEAFAQLHRTLPASQWRQHFAFPRTRDAISVPAEMTKLANPALPVVASLCAIPERVDMLRQTLASLAPQVDELHIYLDRFDTVPDFVQVAHPNVTVRLARNWPGLRDNAKFLPLLDRREDCYFFTADDDIAYPADYVNALVKKIDHYGRQVVVGVHGVLLPERPQAYYTGFRRVMHFAQALEKDTLVNNLGTGTVAFHSSLLKGLDYRQFRRSGIVDLYLAAFCRMQGIPMVALERPEEWLVEWPLAQGQVADQSLFSQGMQDDESQSLLVRQHVPWGYTAIRRAVKKTAARGASPEVVARLHDMLPLLPQCLS